MAKKLESEEWWSILFLAAMGAMVGAALATIRHLLHDHSGLTPEEVLQHHFIPELFAAMTGSAILVGGASAIRSWLKRRS